MKNLSVNRYLKDKALDHIDHALGRPLDPLKESYRNYFFLTKEDSDLAKAFRASPYWNDGQGGCGGIYFSVTREGRQALTDHLKEHDEGLRGFVVEIKNWADETVFDEIVAKTHSGAKYDAFIGLSDVDPDLTFKKFLTDHCGSVRLAEVTS